MLTPAKAAPMHYPHLALLKTTCLFLVVVMHCVMFFTTPIPFWKLYAPQSLPLADMVVAVAGATLIQCFMFASGFLFAASWASGRRTTRQLALHRARRLLLPWLGVGMLWVAPLYTLFSIPAFGHPADATLAETWKMVLSGRFTDHLWFLLVLFWVTLFWIIALAALRKFRCDTIACGTLLALFAALCMQNYGGDLRWYCLWETPPFILCYFGGILAFRNREALDSVCRRHPLSLGGGLAVFIVLLWPYAAAPVAGWAVSLLCALLAYHVFLLASGIYSHLKKFAPYAWFERNGFRVYLFHLPTPLLVFMWLYTPLGLSPAAFTALNIIITLAVTALVVAVGRKLEQKLGLGF